MNSIRKLFWFFKGLNEYTNNGYNKATKFFDNRDLNVSLSNKSIMITGANSGIGKATALELAKHGAVIHMICRDPIKGKNAQNEIIFKSNNPRIHLHIVDLSIPSQVYDFAMNYINSNLPLDILVNNAGCMINKRKFVEGNLEANFATNTLGFHILTKTLIPVLAKAPNPRVFVVSSAGMLLKKLNPYDINSNKMKKFDGQMVYAHNKRQQISLIENYAKQYPSIYFAAMHPGWADTPGVQKSMPGFHQKLLNKLRTAEQGADTLIWMCAYTNLEKWFKSGSFFQDRKPVAKHLKYFKTKCDEDDEIAFIFAMNTLYKHFASKKAIIHKDLF